MPQEKSRILPRIAERLEALANPLLVKEMYQSLHNRRFIGALWLLLLLSLGAYVLVYSGSRGDECGDTMFSAFTLFLAGVAWMVLPYLAFSNLEEEVKSQTIELIHITRLSARRQVRGRLMAAGAKLGLLFSLVGPFALAAFLFKGVGVGAIVGTLSVILLVSIALCSVGILFAALTSRKELRTIAKWGFFLFLVIFTIQMLMTIGSFFVFRRAFSGGPDVPSVFVFLTWGVFTCLGVWFVSAAAANTITFEADRSSARTKFIVLLYILIAALAIAIGSLAGGPAIERETVRAFEGMTVIPLSACCLFWLTGPDRVARRFQRKLQERSPAYKLLVFPFTDGLGASAAYAVLALGLIFLLVSVLLVMVTVVTGSADSDRGVGLVFGFAATYTFYLSALTRVIAAAFPARLRTEKLIRGILLGIIGLNLVALIWGLAAARGDEFPEMSANPLTAFFPLLYVAAAGRGHGEPVFDLFLPAAFGLIFHGLAVSRRFRKYDRGEYR